MTTVDQSAPDHRANVYYDESMYSWIYRASAVGACSKMLLAARLDYEQMPAPEWMQAKMNASAALEDDAIDHFLADHANQIRSIERDVKPSIITVRHPDGDVPGVIIRGKPDTAIHLLDGTSGIIEVKNLSTGLYEANVAKLSHRYETQGTIYGIGWDFLWFVLREKLTEQQISEGQKPRIHYVKFEQLPINPKDIINKVLRIEDMANPVNNPNMELPKSCDIPSFPCPVFYTHETEEYEPWENEELMQEFNELCRAYADAMNMESKSKRAKKALQQRIYQFKGLHPEYFKGSEEGGVMQSPTAKFAIYTSSRPGLDEVELGKFLAKHGKHVTEFNIRNEFPVTRITYRG